MAHFDRIEKMMKRLFVYTFTSLLLFVLSSVYAGVRDDEVASVKVYKEIFPSKVVYTYEVTNNGSLPLIGFTVGFDYYRGNPELSGVHPLQVISPAFWISRVVSLEESDRYEVSWDINDRLARINPGQTLVGFKIEMAQHDLRFTSSHWSVIVDGPPSNVSSTLQLVQGLPPATDTIPPQISVVLSPNKIWPPNRKMEEVTAVITVSDDKDLHPVVKLVSITCNECDNPVADIADAVVGTDDRTFLVRADRIGKSKEGRVYIVTYSATDSAGNSATAQATVTVPHDQRR